MTLADTQIFRNIVQRVPRKGRLLLDAVMLEGKDNYVRIEYKRQYVGCITRSVCVFKPVEHARTLSIADKQVLWATLVSLEKAWSKTIADYGTETGICACCGKELTHPDSLARGVGPDCAKRWNIL